MLRHDTASSLVLASVVVLMWIALPADVMRLDASAGAAAAATAQMPADAEPRERVTINGHDFHLEYAADAASRARGLMGRDEIDEDGGMIFIYPRPNMLSFWMKDCLVDIDLIFLDGRGRVVDAFAMKMAPPRSADESQREYEARLRRYVSHRPAQFAIELRAGWLDRLKLTRGDEIELDLARLKKMARIPRERD